MIDQQRLVLIIESSDPQNLDSVIKISQADPNIDEVRLVIPKDNSALKGVALHWKYRDFRIQIYHENITKHLARKCQEYSTLYVFIGKDICWVSPNAISRLAQAHQQWKDHFVTFMALAASDQTGYLMQVMGLLPDALLQPWHADYLLTYKLDHPDIQAEAHEQILYCAKSGQMHLIDFGRWIADISCPLHSMAFCFRGEEWSASAFFVKTSEINSVKELVVQASHVAMADAEKRNAICGAAWCAEINERTKGVKHRYVQGV